MAYEQYDVEGYLREDGKLKRNEVAYALQLHEINSLHEISQSLERGTRNREQLREYLAYLDNLEVKLSTIIVTEEKEGVINMRLKSDLNNVRSLKRDVSLALERQVKTLRGG